MAAGFETELKLGLPDEAAWRWVRDRIAPVRVEHQTNHFFDRPDRSLARARIGVRLRETEGRLRLTVKGEAEGDGGDVITRRIELERDRPPADLAAALAGGLRLRDDLAAWRAAGSQDPAPLRFLDRLEAAAGRPPLPSIGAFRNERSIGALRLVDAVGALEIEIELDRTEFPSGRTDFEIEVERSSEPDGRLERTRAALERWLGEEGGITTFARESKLARFEALLEAGESRSR